MKNRKHLIIIIILGSLSNLALAQHISTSGIQTSGDIYHLGGRVGIGKIASSAYKLDVAGKIHSSDYIRAGRLLIKDQDADNQIIDFGYNGKMHITHGNNPDDAFKIMTFVGQGKKVGIGTTSPDQKLTVNGTIHSTEVLVDLNVPGPDYVFEEDYPLQDLSSLEQFLKENKHLPEIPSASEMEKDGVKVGEMEMLLLKKVEELTLHIIQQNKLISQQSEDIKQLKQENKRQDETIQSLLKN